MAHDNEDKNKKHSQFRHERRTSELWKRTLDEIRLMTSRKNQKETKSLLSSRKLLLEEWKDLLKKRNNDNRLDDSISSRWERRIQRWSADVEKYLQIQYNVSASSPEILKEMKNYQYNYSSSSFTSSQQQQHQQITSPTFSFPITPRPVLENEPVLTHTDLSNTSKRLLIVTTAALPWMTGTAVNPLLRAAYLTTETRIADKGSVSILLPWLERASDRERVYGDADKFQTKEDQESYIRNWLKFDADMKFASENMGIMWYNAWQQRAENSLYSMGDIIGLISEDEVDICILEEPEHLNWYRAPGDSWTNKFKHVVGVIHTNYFFYAQEQPAALIRAPGMRLLCAWMCRAHCHRLIKLSGTLDQFAPEKELVENVHGVRRTFLNVGKNVTSMILSNSTTDHIFSATAEPTIYFIGKMLWSKGLASLMELLDFAEESAGLRIKIDMYGGGPDKVEAEEKAKKMELDMHFHGPLDHSLLAHTHKIFINPSQSEVLCTTVAEALAMGKFVVVPSHPSNDFFAQFPNCLPYSNKEEFVGNLYYAMTHSPEPLKEEYSYALSWEAATKRFEAAATVSVAEAEAMAKALNTSGIEIEIPLPPLIENKKDRLKIAAALRLTRNRYRQFRSKLSQEIQQSNVLPKDLQRRVVSELDKRLDLDMDEILNSQTLRIKLSPAELDKQLLELYNSITQGPRGDVLRIIGGGTDVGKQYLYLKQQEKKQQKYGQQQQQQLDSNDDLSQSFHDHSQMNNHDSEETLNTFPAERVRQAIRRNLPALRLNLKKKSSSISTSAPPLFEVELARKEKKSEDKKLKMSNTALYLDNPGVSHYPFGVNKWRNTVFGSSFTVNFRPKIR